MREAHDLQHAAEADLHGKGLSRNSVGVLGSVVLGISSVAPAYALTATVGILATQAGSKMAVVIIAGFLPMFFAAYAYREFNKVAPDCGTSFTWTTKAFGPYVGWIGGWVAILATAIVLSNLAGVAVEFFYQFLGDLSGSALIGGLWENKWINVATCLTFLAVATGVAYRGITTTERIQFVLVGFQLAILLIFAGLAIAKSRTAPTGLSFSWDWFSPAGLTLSAFIAGLSGSIFAFWGWDTCLTVNEESKGSAKTPGRAALLTVISILLTYLIVATATQMYAGVGDQGVGLGNEDNASNVFGELAEPVLGSPWHLLLYLAVLASSIASLSAVIAHHVGNGVVPGPPAPVRIDPPPLSDAVLRDRRSRQRRRDFLCGHARTEPQCPDRHDLRVGHHDLLLLRSDGVRLHLVLPPGVIRERVELRVQVVVSVARRPWPVLRSADHAARFSVTRLWQRRKHFRRGPGTGTRPRTDPARRRAHVHLAS